MNSSGVTESGESEKVLLLMESGVRLHTTAYARYLLFLHDIPLKKEKKIENNLHYALSFSTCSDKKNTPSGFTLKLRKHIRTRRLEDVRQLGYDRVGIIILISFFLIANLFI